MKFPPPGTRATASGYGNSDYIKPTDRGAWMAGQDAETTLVVHIETRRGYENAEEIIGTPGVDMVYVGPGDFSIEMGHPGGYDHPEVVGPMGETLEICKRHGVPFGTTTSDADAAGRWIAKGAQFFEGPHELAFIFLSASQFVKEYRKHIP